jgi:hypothetical protein
MSDFGINTADETQLTAALRWHGMLPDCTPEELVEAIRAIPGEPQEMVPVIPSSSARSATTEHSTRRFAAPPASSA